MLKAFGHVNKNRNNQYIQANFSLMITKPTLILDVDRCKQNINTMAEKAASTKLQFRPHFKTHQSIEIGGWFKEVGVNGITVSSLSMAEYFSQAWDDITVAFPVNVREIETINKLASCIKLNLLVESVTAVENLSKVLEHVVGVFIKVNLGNDRTGINPSNKAQIDKVLRAIEVAAKIEFLGFLGHAGQTYSCRGEQEILEVHQKAKHLLVRLKDQYKNSYPNLIASYGDTPSCSIAKDFDGLDEIRPGNFVFYDLMQVQIGACLPDQIAVAMACPVVALHADRQEAIIYGGGIHFSKDRMQHPEYGTIYGIPVIKKQHGWGSIMSDSFVRSLSQEHGVVILNKENFNSLEVGDLIYILPVHSCMTADLLKSYSTLEGSSISMFNPL